MESGTGRYTAYMYTIGAGYIWNIYRGFYLNSWVGAHLKIGGFSARSSICAPVVIPPPGSMTNIVLSIDLRHGRKNFCTVKLLHNS